MRATKIGALSLLAVILLCVLPATAFGMVSSSFNFYASSVSAPEGRVEAQYLPADPDKGGHIFILVLVGVTLGDDFYIASSRGSNDSFFYEVPGFLDNFAPDALTVEYSGAYRIPEAAFEHIASTTYTVKIKVVSSVPGISQVVFGICPECVADYARGRVLPYQSSPIHDDHSVSNVILSSQRFPAEFSAPKLVPDIINLSVQDYTLGAPNGDGVRTVIGQPKQADGTYSLIALVLAHDGGGNYIPVSNVVVTFTITDGEGGAIIPLSQTTNTAGKAEVSLLYGLMSDIPETIEVLVSVDGLPEQEVPPGGYRTDKVRLLFDPIRRDCIVFTTGNVEGIRGQHIQIPIQLVNNPGLATVQMNLVYPSILIPVAVTDGDVWNTKLTVNMDQLYIVQISGASASLNNGDGTLALVEFKIKQNTVAAYYPITMIVVDLETLDAGNAPRSLPYDTLSSFLHVTSGMKGDVDGDDQVTMTDVVWTYQFIRGHKELTIQQQLAIDVNMDGIVNLQDTLLMYQYFRKIIDALPS